MPWHRVGPAMMSRDWVLHMADRTVHLTLENVQNWKESSIDMYKFTFV